MIKCTSIIFSWRLLRISDGISKDFVYFYRLTAYLDLAAGPEYPPDPDRSDRFFTVRE